MAADAIWILFLGHNMGVDQHVCTKSGMVMENSSQMRWIGQKSGLENPRWQTTAIFNFKKSYYNTVTDWDICTNFCVVVMSMSVKSAMC